MLVRHIVLMRWFSVVVILFAVKLQAATYHISSMGDDAATGLSPSNAWRTIARVNAQGGDGHVFRFNRGDIFRGEIVANGKNIAFGAYGSGARPSIRGSVVITNWIWDAPHNCYVADNTNILRHLFVNGELMRIARYPNADAPNLGWLETDTGTSKRVFSDAALGAYGKPDNYWTGATVRIRPCSWLFEMRTVATSTASGTITLSSDLTDTGGPAVCPGWGYYLDGILEELDHEKEWCQAGGKVYLAPPGGVNPNTLLVEGMHNEHGIFINWAKTNMLVENLAFKHQVDAAVETSFTIGATIRNCHFSQCEETGVKIGYASTNIAVESNVFEDMMNFAVAKYQSGATGPGLTVIQSNVIRRTALVAGYGQDGSMQSEAIRCIGGGTIVRRNIIEDVGYVGIGLDSGGHLCEENIIRRAQLLLDDGGTIDINSGTNIVRRNLIFGTYGNRDVSNGQLASGWVHGRMGFSIFTQPNDNGNIIEHNTLANNTGGILLDTTVDSRVRSNLVYNTTSAYIPWHISLLSNYNPMGMGDQITDNIFYSLSSTQGFLGTVMNYDSGFIDRNYYCNPYGAVMMSENYTNYTLAQWRARYPARDPNSVTSLVVFPADAVTGIPRKDSKLFVNTNSTPTVFNLQGNTYQDLDGNQVTGSVLLAPYRSVVLILRVAVATLAAPTNLAASDGVYSNKVTVTWNAVAGATGYSVWRNTMDNSASAGKLADTAATAYDDISALRNKTYYYWAKATNGTATSAFSGSNRGWRRGLPSGYEAGKASQLAVYYTASGQWYIRDLDGHPVAWAVKWGWPNAVPVPGDYDGDGVSDLAVFSQTSGKWYIYSLDGRTIAWTVGWGWPGAKPVSGDYDGDGKSDLAVFDQNTGGWFIYSLDGRKLAWNVKWGWSGVQPVPGDYDGDGKSDLAVFDQNTGGWFIYSLDGRKLAWNVKWGWKGVEPTPGDYDGDGNSDLAVFDQNTGAWFIFSLDGRNLAWNVKWGWPGADPVPGDYDGDGINDLGVFDQSTGAWYVYSLDGRRLAWGVKWGWPGAQPVPGARW